MGNSFTAYAEEPEVLSISTPVDIPVETVEIDTPAPVLEAEEVTMPPLTDEDIESVKQEIIDDLVGKLSGEDDENLKYILKPEIVTAPYDPRFPNTNQSRHCFIRYNEYYKCLFERSEDHPRCQFYKRAHESMCPAEWLEQWQELRDQGLWVGKY